MPAGSPKPSWHCWVQTACLMEQMSTCQVPQVLKEDGEGICRWGKGKDEVDHSRKGALVHTESYSSPRLESPTWGFSDLRQPLIATYLSSPIKQAEALLWVRRQVSPFWTSPSASPFPVLDTARAEQPHSPSLVRIELLVIFINISVKPIKALRLF